MREVLLDVQNLHKRFGAITATDDLSMKIFEGEVHAIIGPNGAGKSTLLAQISGELLPTSGHIHFAGLDIGGASVPERSLLGMARSFQITSLCLEMTALENVSLAVQAHASHSFKFWKNASFDSTLVDPALQILNRVGLTSREHLVASQLAYGEQRQLELGIALASKPRLMLLDEPMAGMGREDSLQMIALLRQLKVDHTILLIEHDMEAVFALADRISVLVYGRCIATGTPGEIQANAEVRRAYLGEDSELCNV